jgi:hypothetical protein
MKASSISIRRRSVLRAEPEPGPARHQHVQHVIDQDPAEGPFLLVNDDH